ncbi:MAG: simple sugar transport system permease protein [Rhodospirillaceae bacterium]|nr:simple sugar transport system permease protein [Rhodospirillaceae bacterium]
MTKLLARNEFFVALVLVAFCVTTALVEPRFLSLQTLFDLLRNGIVIGIFAIGVLLALASGGIDVSFTAIAAFAMYAATKLMMTLGFGDSMIVAFFVSGGIGLLLGLINAVFIGTARLPTLIVTLGTLSVFRGFLLTFIGSQLITTVPAGMRSFSRSMLIRITTADGSFYSLPSAFLFLVAIVVITWFLLYRTMLGRSIFAMGGSREAAARIGINVVGLQYFVYGFVGVLSGLAGIIHASLARVANPFDLVGLELSVIAAVVLGGARLSGGYGTITGTLLGVALIVVINNSLIMLGIPSTWQNVVIGLLILLGTGGPALQARLRAKAA